MSEEREKWGRGREEGGGEGVKEREREGEREREREREREQLSCFISSLSFSIATPRTLFRGNSLASKSFDQFMKVQLIKYLASVHVYTCVEITLDAIIPMPAQVVALPFLHEILSESIDTVYNDHKICELDIEQLKQGAK